MTHASRNTMTGLDFENAARISCPSNAIDLTKNKLYSYLKDNGIDWRKYISRKLLPDNAFLFEADKEVVIYEKKFQQCNGSADEKPQTCAFKIMQYRKLFSALGIEKVSYIYVFNDWFENAMYRDMLDYIKSVDGCDYIFYHKGENILCH